jgi:hypothetical protein
VAAEKSEPEEPGRQPEAAKKTPPAGDAVPAGVVRTANRILVVVAALFVMYALFGRQFERPLVFRAGLGVAVALLACLLLRPSRRLTVALSALPVVLFLHGFETYLMILRPNPATVAARAGRPWDNRARLDVMHDLEAEGKDAWPSLLPSVTRKTRKSPGLVIDGRQTVALGGISGVTTIGCNESGTWSSFEADEHGFNNPKGLWSPGQVAIGMVGDSYTLGACVAPEASIQAHLRARYPGTVSLGSIGNGPLLELAGIVEYLTVLRPKTVLWLYFRNDLDDLNAEKTDPLLLRYVNEEGFRQGLLDEQPAIDAGLRTLLTAGAAETNTWSKRLTALGLTRASTPIWIQDLVMAEQHSSIASVIRLSRATQMAERASQSPDFDLLGKVLARAKQVTASWGGALTFVYLPDFWYASYPTSAGYRERMLALLKDLDVPVIDFYATYRTLPHPEALQFHWNSHFNETGYTMIAEAILDALAKGPGAPRKEVPAP